MKKTEIHVNKTALDEELLTAVEKKSGDVMNTIEKLGDNFENMTALTDDEARDVYMFLRLAPETLIAFVQELRNFRKVVEVAEAMEKLQNKSVVNGTETIN
jgi:hypothetical protein